MAIVDFYPRPLRGGRRQEGEGQEHRQHISIHALCEEGDPAQWVPYHTTDPFLSTPSARRATGAERCTCPQAVFLSTPSARRATTVRRAAQPPLQISIHALCEEGDLQGHQRDPRDRISIHALCEEGDTKTTARHGRRPNFYPRPLRGGRHEGGEQE